MVHSMIASDAELAQMQRDGTGRASVIKQLVLYYRTGSAQPTPDSVLMRGRWVHYLTRHGEHPFLRIVHTDGSETEVPLK